MAQCPVCQAQIEISEAFHGTLFNCPACSAVFFIGWDGKPEQSGTRSDLPEVEPTVQVDTLAPIQFQDAAQIAEDFIQTEGVAREPAIPDLMMASFEKSIPQTAAESVEAISEFSNQTDEVTSSLSYNLTIRGLDLPQQIVSLREAITDQRFAWEPEKILANIQYGELTIKNINPIKASVLIQRIKYADLDIEWSQNVLS